MKRFIMAALLLLFSGAAAAYDGDHRQLTPAQALERQVDGLLTFLARNPRAPASLVHSYLQERVAPFIDFERMALWVAGPMARTLSPVERTQFQALLRGHMLRTMAQGLAGYPVGDVHYFPPRGTPAEGDVILGLGVRGPDAPPVRIDFRMMNGPYGWRVVDVSANGISAVAFYRSMLRQMVGSHGLEAALAQLR